MSYLFNCFPWAWSHCRNFILRSDTAAEAAQARGNGAADHHESPAPDERQPLLGEANNQPPGCGTLPTQSPDVIPSGNQECPVTNSAQVPRPLANLDNVEWTADTEAGLQKGKEIASPIESPLKPSHERDHPGGEEASASQTPLGNDEEEPPRGRRPAQREPSVVVNPPTRNNTIDVNELANIEAELPPRQKTCAIISSADALNGLILPSRKEPASRTEKTNMSPSSILSTGSGSRREARKKVADEEDDQNVAFRNVGDHFPNSSGDHSNDSANHLEDEPPRDPPQKLEDLLMDESIEWPSGEHRYFIPIDAQNRLITIASIESELRRIRQRGVQPSKRDLERNALDVWTRASKLFAILVCLGKQRCIYNFLKEGLDDDDLPFVKTQELVAASGSKAWRFKLSSRRTTGKPINCMANWSQNDNSGFVRDQWWMFAPIFKEASKVRHMDLQELCVLPYVEDNERTGAVSGGFGAVWSVRIHQAHQLLHKSTNLKNINPLIAIKRLNSRVETEFLQEVEMLKAFSNHKHPHLIKLLATYRLKDRYHLMFPHCIYNLRTYWNATPQPQFTSTSVRWFLSQCKGIAHGLQTIHEYKTSLPEKPGKPVDVASLVRYNRYGNTLGVGSVVLEKDEHIFGRHGDIKPENILWSDEHEPDEECSVDNDLQQLGLLLIADFGLMDFHGESSRSLVPADMAASLTYAPPELMLKKDISRKYDIWSLGCVYLEFVTWLVAWLNELRRFPEARALTGPGTDVSDDCFFTNVGEKDAPSNAIVRESVTEWMKDLHENPRCSQFIHDFVDLISEDMLVIDQHDRIPCGPLNDRLHGMCKKGLADEGYLIDPKPRLPRHSMLTPTTIDNISRISQIKDQEGPPQSSAIPQGNALPRKDTIPFDLDTTTQSSKSPRMRAFSPPPRAMSPLQPTASPMGMIRLGSPNAVVMITPAEDGLVGVSTSPP